MSGQRDNSVGKSACPASLTTGDTGESGHGRMGQQTHHSPEIRWTQENPLEAHRPTSLGYKEQRQTRKASPQTKWKVKT